MMRATTLAALLLCTGAAAAQDHAGHDRAHHDSAETSPEPQDVDPHAAHRRQEDTGSGYIPPALTDADRAAAFPDLSGHDMSAHMDDDPFVWMVTGDRLEWRQGDVLAWEGSAWFGHDRGRLWLRSEGERERGHGSHGKIETLWGVPVDAWWDVLAGLRHDIGDGPRRDWLALGVQGLAPYKFEVQATAYLGTDGRTALTAEAEYELLLSNRLILQPRAEIALHGRDDPASGVGAGLSETAIGLRLRYEIRREIAPYVGIEWRDRHGRSGDFARAAGETASDRQWVAGLRFWF